jgi:hypothetical protein
MKNSVLLAFVGLVGGFVFFSVLMAATPILSSLTTALLR